MTVTIINIVIAYYNVLFETLVKLIGMLICMEETRKEKKKYSPPPHIELFQKKIQTTGC